MEDVPSLRYSDVLFTCFSYHLPSSLPHQCRDPSVTTPAAIEEMRSVAGSSGFKVKRGT